MIYVFGDYELDTQRGELRHAHTVCHIEPRGFQMLEYLIKHRDHVVTKAELLSEVWHMQSLSDSALSSCLRRVRKVVGDTGDTAPVIKTQPRQGYRFVAEVEERSSGHSSAPWRSYLETLGQYTTEPLTEAHAREVLQAQWTLLVCPYAEDKQTPLHALAAWCARWWLQGDETMAVPLFLPVGRFQAGGQPDRLSLEGLSAAIRVDSELGLAPTLLPDQLRAGALILLEGADVWARFADGERLPALVQALATLGATSALTRVALTCNEATAEGLTALLQQYDIHPRTLALYEGRSNFLDQHRSAVVKGARSRILACQRGALGRTLTPEQFFYEPTHPLYVRIGVREEGTEPKPLDEVLLAAHNAAPTAPRLLLLGDGGAGKSTALLKLFFDCAVLQSSSPLQGRWTPWLVRLGPLFAPWRQEPQGLTLDALLRRLQEDIGWGTFQLERDNTPLFRTAIQWTPGLLLLLDGLDEIQPATPAARDAISRVLAEFLALCPAASVVVTSRQSEVYRGERSLRRSALFEAWRQLEIDELTWSDIDVYLQRAGHAAVDARARHALLASHPGLLQQPLLLYLFATTPLQALQGQPLTRARLFREAVQIWLQQELNEKLRALPVTFPPGPPVEGLVQLIGLVAVRMLEQAQDAIQDEDVAEALRHAIASHPQPPAWWPRTQDGRGFGYGPPVHDDEVWDLVHCLKGLCVFTEGFHFQHEAFREYFAAEALRALCEAGLRLDASSDVRQATLHELECLARDYATWSPVLSLLPDLLRDRVVVQALIDWCEHGQAQLFGLDCLPALYACAGNVEALWRRVRDAAFQQQKLAQHEPCWRSVVADVRLALEHAIQAQRLPEMVRFGLLLPWATWAVRFTGYVTPLAAHGRYETALQHVDLLAAPRQASVRYRLLLSIAWMAALNSRQEHARATYHVEQARQALARAYHTDGTIDVAWRPVVLKLVETLLAQEIPEAIEVLKRFGREAGSTERNRAYACRYLAQLAQEAVLPRERRVWLVREAEALANALSGEDHHAELAALAATSAALGDEGDAQRLWASLVEAFATRVSAGETGPAVAHLAEVITATFGDGGGQHGRIDLCTQLCPRPEWPWPLQAYVGACVGARLWALDATQHARQVLADAVSAVAHVRHPLVQVQVLPRVLQAVQAMPGPDHEPFLLPLLRAVQAGLTRYLAVLPLLVVWQRQQSEAASEALAKILYGGETGPDSSEQEGQAALDALATATGPPNAATLLWELTKGDCPPAEYAWIEGKDEEPLQSDRPLTRLTSVLGTLLEALWTAGKATVRPARRLVWTCLQQLDALRTHEAPRGVYWEASWALCRLAGQLHQYQEKELAAQAVQAFVESLETARRSESEKFSERLLDIVYEPDIGDYLRELTFSCPDFWHAHQDQLRRLEGDEGQLGHAIKEIQEALAAGDLPSLASEPEDYDDSWDDDNGRFDYQKGNIRPYRKWVERAKDTLTEGKLVEAAWYFEADALAVKDYEAAAHGEGFLGLTFLTLARRLGQCHQQGQARAVVDTLLHTVTRFWHQWRLWEPLPSAFVSRLTNSAEIPFDRAFVKVLAPYLDHHRVRRLLTVSLAFLRRRDLELARQLLAEVLEAAQQAPDGRVPFSFVRESQQPEALLQYLPQWLEVAEACWDNDTTIVWGERMLAVVSEILTTMPIRQFEVWQGCAVATCLARYGQREAARRMLQRCLEATEHRTLDKRVVDVAKIVQALYNAGQTSADDWAWAEDLVTTTLAPQLAAIPTLEGVSVHAKVGCLCAVVEALAETAPAHSAAPLASATHLAKSCEDADAHAQLGLQIAKTMLHVGQWQQAFAYAEAPSTDPLSREELYLEAAATVPLERGEELYTRLAAVPLERQGDRWVQAMAGLLVKLGRAQGWSSVWVARLAALLRTTHAERLATVDVVLGALVDLCPDENVLITTAEVCQTTRWLPNAAS